MEQFSENPLKINGINGGYKFVPADALPADVINQIVEAVLYNLNKNRFVDIHVDRDAAIEFLQCDGAAYFNGTVNLNGSSPLLARKLDWEVPTSALHYAWLKFNKPSEALINLDLIHIDEQYIIECAHLIRVGDMYIGYGTLYFRDLDSGNIIYTLAGKIQLSTNYELYVQGVMQTTNSLDYGEVYLDISVYTEIDEALNIIAYKRGTDDE